MTQQGTPASINTQSGLSATQSAIAAATIAQVIGPIAANTPTNAASKGFLNSINASMPYKLVFLFLFVFVFYKVIYRICVFFGIDIVILNMYMGWLSFILVLFTFLPYEYGNILETP
jgi:hypothetical protein